MSDHQRIHPVVDIEAPPPRPSRPPPRPMSTPPSRIPEKGDSTSRLPPLTRIPATTPPPPPRKNTSGLCKCIGWTIILLILLLIIIGTITGILYLVFQPKLPNYSVKNLRISDLRLTEDFTLYARFSVNIISENPNKKIGIYYEKGSQLSVWYKNTNLCHGQLPKFYQGHQNKTILDVELTGQSSYGRTLMAALQEEQQTGSIPLDLKINVPVKIKLGNLKLPKVRILGDCDLIVDSLSTNDLVSIKANTCKFSLKL